MKHDQNNRGSAYLMGLVDGKSQIIQRRTDRKSEHMTKKIPVNKVDRVRCSITYQAIRQNAAIAAFSNAPRINTRMRREFPMFALGRDPRAANTTNHTSNNVKNTETTPTNSSKMVVVIQLKNLRDDFKVEVPDGLTNSQPQPLQYVELSSFSRPQYEHARISKN